MVFQKVKLGFLSITKSNIINNRQQICATQTHFTNTSSSSVSSKHPCLCVCAWVKGTLRKNKHISERFGENFRQRPEHQTLVITAISLTLKLSKCNLLPEPLPQTASVCVCVCALCSLASGSKSHGQAFSLCYNHCILFVTQWHHFLLPVWLKNAEHAGTGQTLFSRISFFPHSLYLYGSWKVSGNELITNKRGGGHQIRTIDFISRVFWNLGCGMWKHPW